jgi:competence protein ComEC
MSGDWELQGAAGNAGSPGPSGSSETKGPSASAAARRLLAAAWAGLAEERPRFVNWLPVLFGAGIAAHFALPAEPTLAAALLPFALAMIVRVLAPAAGGLRLVAGALAVAGLGFAMAKARTEYVAAPVLERTLRGVVVTGVVEQREPHAKRGERLTLRLVSIADVPEARLPRRARIRVLTAGAVPLRPGETVTMTATLSPPSPPALPGGYDFARAAYFQQIGAVGYALKAPVRVPGDERGASILGARAWMENLRQDMTARIAAALPGERGAMAAALITGERGGISQETTDAYRDSGLVHILSISGLHMAIMAGAVFALVRALLAAIPAIALTQPIKKWAAAAGAIGALLYLAISGGSAATLRAAIMMVVMFLAIMLGRPAIAMRNVAIAALLILVAAPESLLDVGFQMSFAAVASLVAAYEAVRGRLDRRGAPLGAVAKAGLFFGGIVFSTVVAGLAVMPLSVYHFHAMQHYAPLANLVAVPVCNLVVMPAALLTLVALPFGLETWPLALMGHGIDVMGGVARHVAAMPGAVSLIPQVPDLAFGLVLVGGLWLVLWQRPWRLAGLPALLAGLALAPLGERPDILIGRDGALLAVRDRRGVLVAHEERPSTFELKRWLEWDGDARDPARARRSRVFTCDALGCVADAGGTRVVLSRHPAGLAEDCARAAILVVDRAGPASGCDGPRLTLDRPALKASGTVALYRNGDGEWLVDSVAAKRGSRPWSMAPEVPAGGAPRNDGPIQPNGPRYEDRIGRYAAPSAVAEAFDPAEDARPEIDDEP